jgi:cell division septal protein FtsQ
VRRSRRTRRKRKPVPRRRKIRNIKRAAKIVIPLIVLALVGAALLADLKRYLNDSDRYRVEFIDVTGTNRASEDEIIECSRIRADDPIFSVRLKEAAERIIAHPRVKDAEVAVTVPNHVSILVTERRPVALTVFKKPYELDSEGVILGDYKKGVSPEGPIISGVKKPGSPIEGARLTADGLKEALELRRIFSSNPIAKQLTVSEIDISERNSLIMILANKRYEIRWPRENLDECLYRLALLWKETDGFPGVRQYIDLRFRDPIPTR